ncbi:hypothetical protein, partial [Aquabacterium sp.]|uniref:hypothetical protein n=1 Tax=Aquabacterium sp. TaxID=1872578 RepID=UPI0025B9553E
SMSMFDYAGNNGVNANDPMGLQTSVACAGRSCSVTQNNVFFTDPGYTPDFAKSYQNTIQSRMTGTFPPSGIQLNTTVNFAPNNKPVFGGIEVNVQLGSRVKASDGSSVMGTTQLSLGVPSVLVQLPEKTNPYTIVHEGFFHAVCPSCQYSGHNEPGTGIMNAYSGQPQKITSSPIEEALRGIGNPNFTPVQQRQEPIFGTGAYNSSAAGGFLLYPNKTNTNQMQSVYAK